MPFNQKTISKELTFSGIGLHSGKKVTIKLLPAKENSGIFFNFNKNIIIASWEFGQISQLCTQIKKNKIIISTIEHLMSSLSGLGIDNLEVKTDSGEMPILDGSSKEFYEKILENGLCEQNFHKKFILIKKEIFLKEKNKYIRIEPSQSGILNIKYTIDYNDQFIKKQTLKYQHNFENYKNIYKARTFCLHEDLEKIFSMGLGRGGSLENAIVVSGKKILNQGGLRYKDEFVRHKILDCIGDLYLAKYHIIGNITVYGGGHELNLKLLQAIFKNKKNYAILN